MWQITRQFDDFGRFYFIYFSISNLLVFLAQNEKYPKNTILKKLKCNKNTFFFIIKQLISNIIYTIPIVWFSWFCLFVLLFTIFRPFLSFKWFSCFSLLWKMRSSKRKAVFNVSISQLNKTSYQIKKYGSTPLRYNLGAKKPILAIFGTLTTRLVTKLCPYKLIFHAYLEENRIETFCFV